MSPSDAVADAVPAPAHDPAQAATEALLRKFQKELSAGTVSLALLAVLAAAAEPMYGYQIAKTLERQGGGSAARAGVADSTVASRTDSMAVAGRVRRMGGPRREPMDSGAGAASWTSRPAGRQGD